MRNANKEIELFLREAFPLMNLGAWEPKTDAIIWYKDLFEHYSKETGVEISKLDSFVTMHEIINRQFQVTIPIISMILLNSDSIGLIVKFEKLFGKGRDTELKELALINAIISNRIYVDVEPLIEAYYFYLVENKKEPIFKSHKNEILGYYSRAAQILEKMIYCRNSTGRDALPAIAIFRALNNPKIAHKNIIGASKNIEDFGRLTAEDFSNGIPFKETSYERFLSIMDAIDGLKHVRDGFVWGPNFSDDGLLDIAMKLANVEYSELDFSRFGEGFKNHISYSAYLAPEKKMLKALKNDMEPHVGIWLKDGKWEIFFPRGHNTIFLRMNLVLTWALQQILEGKSEISCFLEKFNGCAADCALCSHKSLLKSAAKISEIFHSIELPLLESLWESIKKPAVT